jgi:DNA-binding NarL/FixJ family response regulator
MHSIPRKVLILDDCLTDREICRRFLARAAPEGTYQCVEHGSLEGACEAVRAAGPHCVLLDYHLHDGTGIEFLQRIDASAQAPEFAVVMLTGTGHESIAVESIQNGAHAYLLKDSLSPDRLRDAVEGALLLKRGLEVRNRRAGELLRHLREENERLSGILATLPHELRTSLTPILIAAGLLQNQAEASGKIRKIADVILKNAESQARTIDARLGPVVPRPYGK